MVVEDELIGVVCRTSAYSSRIPSQQTGTRNRTCFFGWSWILGFKLRGIADLKGKHDEEAESFSVS